MSKATFAPFASFDGKAFRNADFKDAEFVDKVSFRNAQFTGATDFRAAKFNGVGDFTGARRKQRRGRDDKLHFWRRYLTLYATLADLRLRDASPAGHYDSRCPRLRLLGSFIAAGEPT